ILYYLIETKLYTHEIAIRNTIPNGPAWNDEYASNTRNVQSQTGSAIPASAAVRRATDRSGEPVAIEKQLYTHEKPAITLPSLYRPALRHLVRSKNLRDKA
ncbi:hypothetical protein, partial [uncultured Imperialibacter sp.]|uniref:hypothetical protein n=1 Tax=uncultured Imperialibacter sp. TaxID=1672639 RepID=UPI0030DDA494